MTTIHPKFTLLKAADAAAFGIEIAAGSKANVGATSPFKARKRQHDLIAQGSFKWVLYSPSIGKPVCVRVSRRQLELLSKLQNGAWWQSSQLKSLSAETRKPLSELRQCGFIIAVRGKPAEYQLLGSVDLNPSLTDRMNNPDVLTVLSSIDDAAAVEIAKARKAIAICMFNINKTAELMKAFAEVA